MSMMQIIIGELLAMEKYQFIDSNLIAAIAMDIEKIQNKE